MMKRVKVNLAIGVMVLAGLITSPLLGQKVGEKAPDFEVDLLEGGKWKLSDHEGKVILVFWFGNTCGLCKSVAPQIEEKLYQANKDDASFTAIGLDTWDSSSDSTSVSAFKSQTGISFQLALKAKSVSTTYGTTYDRLMVIDSEGVLVHKGSLPASNDLDNALDAIKSSLAVTAIRLPGTAADEPVVFPVPAFEQVTFQAGESIRGVRIFDLTGKEVLKQHFGNSIAKKREIPVTALEEGVYLYLLETDSGTGSGKLLIQR